MTTKIYSSPRVWIEIEVIVNQENYLKITIILIIKSSGHVACTTYCMVVEKTYMGREQWKERNIGNKVLTLSLIPTEEPILPKILVHKTPATNPRTNKYDSTNNHWNISFNNHLETTYATKTYLEQTSIVRTTLLWPFALATSRGLWQSSFMISGFAGNYHKAII